MPLWLIISLSVACPLLAASIVAAVFYTIMRRHRCAPGIKIALQGISLYLVSTPPFQIIGVCIRLDSFFRFIAVYVCITYEPRKVKTMYNLGRMEYLLL
ncbi:hypothetical protein SEVIR_8G070251v4 [Setaria viridis]